MASKIRSLSQKEIYNAAADLSRKYAATTWPFSTREVLMDCISALGGLFAAQTSINNEPRRYYFFRVRNAASFSNEEEVLDPKQFTYPPVKYCVSVGRAHIPGHPVFYASDSYEAAIREMKTPSEKYYFVSCWYSESIILSKLNFLFADNITSQRLRDNFKRAISDMWSQHNVEDEFNRNRMKAHLCAWSNLFTSENYTITSSIAHQNMYGSYANHEIICYCSAIDGAATNYAILPSLADKLTLHRVYSVSITDLYGEIGFIQCASVGNDGMLTWRQITENDLPENDPFLPTVRGDNYNV